MNGFNQSSAGGQKEKADTSSLRIIYFNARSLTNKLNDLCILISDCDPDLILETETWCDETVSTAMLNIHYTGI